MTLEELLASNNRKVMEELLLWVIKESHGDDSWIYGVYSRNMTKLTLPKIKAILEVSKETAEEGLELFNLLGFCND